MFIHSLLYHWEWRRSVGSVNNPTPVQNPVPGTPYKFFLIQMPKRTIAPGRTLLLSKYKKQFIKDHKWSAAKLAEYLHFTKGWTRWELIGLKLVTKSQWKRMMAAHQCNRPVGINGRPRLVSKELIKTHLHQLSEDAERGIFSPVRKFNTIVSSSFSFISFSYLRVIATKLLQNY